MRFHRAFLRAFHDAFLLSVLAVGLLPIAASADEVVLQPVADATLYEQASGNLANGVGDHLFAGRTLVPDLRRAVLRFDLAVVPPGSIVESVEVDLNMSRTLAGTEDVSLHRVTTSWTEGPSDAPGEEGQGAAAQSGDVTWLHTSYDTTFWTTPGGDYVPTPSATVGVGGLGTYTWGSTTGLVADVQGWVDAPASNDGWILVGDEAGLPTAKRFDSRENTEPGVQPELRVTFTPVVATPTAIPTLDPRALAALALLLALAGSLLVSKL